MCVCACVRVCECVPYVESCAFNYSFASAADDQSSPISSKWQSLGYTVEWPLEVAYYAFSRPHRVCQCLAKRIIQSSRS